MNYKILTGTAVEVEKELNALSKEWFLTIEGMSSTNEQTTVLVDIAGAR